MKAKTESGSVYEIDLENKKVRRLQGMTPPTHRMEGDEWKPYEELYPETPKVNSAMFFVWPFDPEKKRGTYTSLVVEVTE